MQTPDRFSRMQIILHWTIAALIVAQFLFSGAMETAWRAVERNTFTDADFTAGVGVHIAFGIAVLILAIWRVVLRVRHGAPPPPESEPKALQMLASIVHLVLYGAMFLMPITGMMAWGGGIIAAGEWHQAVKMVLIVAVTLHVAGALVHHFVWKTNVLRRMLGTA